MSNCSHASNFFISPLYSGISESFLDRLSDLLDTVGVGVKVAEMGLWFLIVPIKIAVIVVINLGK